LSPSSSTALVWYRQGDAANAILAAVGYNFRRLIRWLRILFGNSCPLSAPDLRSPACDEPARNQQRTLGNCK
jgi:hypothetical protein